MLVLDVKIISNGRYTYQVDKTELAKDNSWWLWWLWILLNLMMKKMN